jgi:hypothetical protein
METRCPFFQTAPKHASNSYPIVKVTCEKNHIYHYDLEKRTPGEFKS